MQNVWVRILVFFLSSLGIMAVLTILISFGYPQILAFNREDIIAEIINSFVAIVSISASIIFFNETRVWRRLLLSFSFEEFSFGNFLAFIILAPTLFCLAIFQLIDFEFQTNRLFELELFSLLLVAVVEELLLRGFILESLRSKYSPAISILASSAIFGLLHIFNDNLSIVGLVNITLSGLILGFLYVRFNTLAAPIGMHFFWNVFQGPIFGFNVSGNEYNSIFELEYLNQTDFLTGGAFGLEGSLLLLVAQGLVCWYLFRQTRGLKTLSIEKIIAEPSGN
jgi:uncharacterized protein